MGSSRSNKSDFLTGGDGEGDAVQEDMIAVGELDFLRGEERWDCGHGISVNSESLLDHGTDGIHTRDACAPLLVHGGRVLEWERLQGR